MKTRNKPLKIIASPFILSGLIFAEILCYGIFIFIYSYPVARGQLTPFTHFICIAGFAVLPMVVLIAGAYRGFLSLIIIDNYGIRTSVLGIFPVRRVLWSEMYEIRYYERVRPFFLFSKCSLENLTYEQIIKIVTRKDAVQVELTKKVYQAVKSFTDKPIVNLSEDRIKLLRLEK